ncbi:MAG: hypothetical protein ACJ75H_01645 [Thermoanaerobaculia bacterium]
MEHKLSWARGQLTKLLHGTYNLKVSHVLAILDVIGVEPLRFYSMVHGEPGSLEKRKGDLVSRVLQSFPEADPTTFALPSSMTADELEARIEAALERALARRDRQ